MPSAVRYHELTLYILNYLTQLNTEVPVSERRLKIAFIEPVSTVFKGVTKAKSELLKKPQHRQFINYRILGLRDYKANEITFSIEYYAKDIRQMPF
jgi:hypothetical protein